MFIEHGISRCFRTGQINLIFTSFFAVVTYLHVYRQLDHVTWPADRLQKICGIISLIIAHWLPSCGLIFRWLNIYIKYCLFVLSAYHSFVYGQFMNKTLGRTSCDMLCWFWDLFRREFMSKPLQSIFPAINSQTIVK